MLLPQKLGIGGAVMFFMGIIIGWVVFPIALKSQVHEQTELSKTGEMREMWSKLPFPWQFRVYLFNITNPEAIEMGEKPIVHQVGPYYYDEWKEKVNLVDNDEDDTVEFNRKVTYHFNPSKSNGLTGDEELVYPHLAILSIMMVAISNKPNMASVASKAIESIFHKPDTIFTRVKAREIIFDGLPIDCTVKDFAGSAVCSLLKMQSDLVVVGDDMYKFSLFGHRNGTVSSATTKVYRGIKNSKDLGRVLEWNNQSAQTVWPEDHCNAYRGTEGTIFHPFFDKAEDVVSFAPDICRSLSFRYQKPTKVYGLRANRYTSDLGDQSSVPEEKCFCPTPETCLKKGAMNLHKCIGKPVIATLPHFYLADPSYLETVSGLHPAQKDHELYVDMEPMTGTPLQFRITIQFNMFILPVEKFKLMKTFPEALLPLFWIEEGIEFPDNVIGDLKSAFRLITIVSCIKWIMLVLGLGLAGAAGALEYKRRQLEKTLQVIPVAENVDASNNAKNNAEAELGQKWPMNMNISSLQSATVPTSVDRN